MKKIILISTMLLLTGCFGEAGKGYITKTCIKNESINGNNVNTNILIKSKTGTVEEITITETYDEKLDITSITNSKKSEQNLYKENSGITIEINDNVFTYTINTKEASELVKDRFNIKEEQHKQIKFYEDTGYTCK